MNDKITVQTTEGEQSWITPREFQVIDFCREGWTNKEIAAKMKITRDTAEVHRHHALHRLKCKNMPQLISLLFQQGILT